MKKLIFPAILIGVLAAVTLSGCATIVSGPSQGITFNTDPVGATCSVARSGEQLAVISATPGKVTISKGWSPLDVNRNKAGHFPAKASLSTSFQPWTLGNILIGGGLGAIVDAASGAMVQYPSSAMLLLVPSQFSSPQERDAYFDKKKIDIEDETTKLINETRNNCVSPPCDAEIAGIEERKKQRWADLESKRSEVQVNP